VSVGIELSDEDLLAVKKLYSVRWSADIRNWNERGVQGCMWFVTCPDRKGNWLIETNSSLHEAIYSILDKI